MPEINWKTMTVESEPTNARHIQYGRSLSGVNRVQACPACRPITYSVAYARHRADRD